MYLQRLKKDRIHPLFLDSETILRSIASSHLLIWGKIWKNSQVIFEGVTPSSEKEAKNSFASLITEEFLGSVLKVQTVVFPTPRYLAIWESEVDRSLLTASRYFSLSRSRFLPPRFPPLKNSQLYLERSDYLHSQSCKGQIGLQAPILKNETYQ